MRNLPGPFLMLGLCLGLAAQQAHAAQSQAMSFECRRVAANTAESRRRADAWVQEELQAFMPSNEQALRLKSLELQAEQVKLAFTSISSTCAQHLAGTITRDDADLWLSGFEQTISNFLHDIGNEVRLMAARGQVSDIDSIRSTLTQIGATGRQAALLGEDSLADKSRQTLVDSLVAFSSTFVDSSCWTQKFDDELPFSIQRQNEILGTGIDVMPCAKRYFTVDFPPLKFESCTIRGVGDWRVLFMPGPMMGDGGIGDGSMENQRDHAAGDYQVVWGNNGVEYTTSGKMELHRQDNGPGAIATYKFTGDMFYRLTKGKQKISKLEELMGMKVKPVRQPIDMDAKVRDHPCRELDPI